MTKEISGVKIPKSIELDEERANAYAAGYVFHRVGGNAEKMPDNLKLIGVEYRGDSLRSSLLFPEVSKAESSFWAGDLISASDGRDRTRSGSREISHRDVS